MPSKGSIYQRADGRWCASLSMGMADGKRQRKVLTASTRQEAREKLKQLRAGPVVKPDRLTVAAYLDTWLTGMIRPSRSYRTWESYRSIIRRRINPAIGSIPLAQLTPPDIRRMLAGLELTPQSIKCTLRVLRTALEAAVNDGLLPMNLCSRIASPRVLRREFRVWDREEASHFLRAAEGYPDHALYVVALATGMRQGELVALKWDDIDLTRGAIRVQRSLQHQKGKGLVACEPKTRQSRRVVRIGTTVVNRLRQHRKEQTATRLASPIWCEDGYIFATATGLPLYSSGVRDRFRAAMCSAGVPAIRFHDLRHTAATLLLSAGTHPKVVSEMLGHSSIAITLDRYSHFVPALHEDAAMTLDRLLGA